MILSASLLPAPGIVDSSVDIAVVIDVLRATSVMATSLANGATRVITCREVESARKIADDVGDRALLCGERQCQRIDGFHLGNSPAEYLPSAVNGKTIVLTTTNGTRAVESVREAKRIVTASFLNLSAVVAALGEADHVHLVASGTDGIETDEDTLLAGALAEACVHRYGAEITGSGATTANQAWQSWSLEVGNIDANSLCQRLRTTGGGRNLIRHGFDQDLRLCAEIDSLSVVPQRMGRQPPTFTLQSHSATE